MGLTRSSYQKLGEATDEETRGMYMEENANLSELIQKDLMKI